MAGATNESATTEVGLVLQGGGALGAYEWGAILALLDFIDGQRAQRKSMVLEVVTGVSIGAINAACVVGADEKADARTRLEGLWNDFMITAPAFVPQVLTSNFAFYEVPNFYRFSPAWNLIYFYQTKELLKTLRKHVNFTALNASKTAFVVTAADVECGTLTWFANRQLGDIAPTAIGPHHVLASGSIAPQFPWTDIIYGGKERHYWDGGLIDNTPLGAAIDAFDPELNIRKLLVIMNLFPLNARLPNTYTEVSERVDQLRFGNRLRQDVSTARQFNKLISTIQKLAARLPDLPKDVEDVVRRYKEVETIEISLEPDDSLAYPYDFHDFSQQGIERRRDRGYELTLTALREHFAAKTAAHEGAH
jgi:NTE family protein